MKNKRNLLFKIAISSIYILTVLSFGISLLVELKSGPSRVDFRFTELTRETNQNLQVNDPGTDNFTNTFLRSIGDVSDIAGIQLVEDGHLLFSYPTNLAEKNGLQSTRSITKSTNLITRGGKTLTLTASIYTLKPESVSKKGLTAFLVVVFATICAVLYLIIVTIRSGDKKEAVVEDKTDDPTDFFEDEIYQEDSKRIENDLRDEEIVPETPETEEDATDEIQNDDQRFSDFGDELPEDSDEEYVDEDSEMTLSIAGNITQEEYQALTKDLLPESESFSPSQEIVAVPAKKELAPEDMVLNPLPVLEVKKVEEEKNPVLERKTVPEGLFSPVTGFGWEEYMLPRLDSELMRSVSSDQELALFTLSIPKFDWASDTGKEICRIIESRFKFRDMIFEYKSSGCIIIDQGIDSMAALEKAENLRTDIIALMAKKMEYHIVAIGIANRSLRLISGSRLFNESEQALFRALEDSESPIVEFKVDPVKYRNYIAEEATKQDLDTEKSE